jgi:hypothetical protein
MVWGVRVARSLMFPARVPNPFDDDAQQQQRVNSQLPVSTFRAVMIVCGGCVALIMFAVPWRFGLPGIGVALVPFGILMVILGGIELLLSRLG